MGAQGPSRNLRTGCVEQGGTLEMLWQLLLCPAKYVARTVMPFGFYCY